MMPVLGDHRAAVQRSAGSSSIARSAGQNSSSSIPHDTARALMALSVSIWPSVVATISLPQRE